MDSAYRERPSSKILVWDLPVRLFHALLGVAVLGAFVIAIAVGHRSAVFPWHMLLGAAAGFMVLLRAIWGLVGSRHARFGDFAFGPKAVVQYFKSLFDKRAKPHVGHNPGSSVAIFAMLGLTLATALSGAFMSRVEALEELHEVFAFTLIGVVAAHLAGVALHAFVHRDGLVRSMVDGEKVGEPAQATRSSHPLAALAFIGLVTAFGVSVARGYDAKNRAVNLPIVGSTVTLGEGGEDGDREGGPRGKHQENRDFDD
ncbi:MAG: cytochrome b/b6 domain-containing protein [Polyangiaceae bacterium]